MAWSIKKSYLDKIELQYENETYLIESLESRYIHYFLFQILGLILVNEKEKLEESHKSEMMINNTQKTLN